MDLTGQLSTSRLSCNSFFREREPSLAIARIARCDRQPAIE